jgi:hypothetical protein
VAALGVVTAAVVAVPLGVTWATEEQGQFDARTFFTLSPVLDHSGVKLRIFPNHSFRREARDRGPAHCSPVERHGAEDGLAKLSSIPGAAGYVFVNEF